MAEADSACPPGWTIPTVRIWDATLPLLSASDTLNQFQEHHNFYTHDLDLWEEATPLNFNHMNWVQGDRIRKASGSYWFYDEETGDHRTHVHIGKNSAVRHAHDHHIADKPKKVRRFAVRCVAPDSLLYFPPMKSAGLRTLVYMVADLEAAKLWYTKAFGKKPYFDEPFYVGFDIGGYELGLSPIDTPSVGTNAIAYWDVEDVEKAVAALVALGATVFEAPQEVGEGLIVATVLDPWGNPVGLIRNPHFKLPK
jgi:predicted enzyme related to lactoylglutathione lyase